MKPLSILGIWGRRLQADTRALCLAAKHPRTPWLVRLLVLAILAYALSPVDLIPDFIPLVGYLDDLILVPAGLALAIRLLPPEVLAECRQTASEQAGGKQPVNRLAGAVVLSTWFLALVALAWWMTASFRAPPPSGWLGQS